ncbi:gamma-interferon-inducible lysosomal thiol reductase-like [Zerene cesonia]|uniref:gamma-interferon-inducible lysosomal thiol reductase-like n=1 Tax=Zerene cesonia TaxID=33412 RepID=UPI0018E4DCAC|nr:gamma-interferon-inducible lysosomal thiol reductase-like [Zerene cesonia]
MKILRRLIYVVIVLQNLLYKNNECAVDQNAFLSTDYYSEFLTSEFTDETTVTPTATPTEEDYYDSWKLTTKVNIKVFYEPLCTNNKINVMDKLQLIVENLNAYVDIELYPYGFSEIKDTEDGIECYNELDPVCYGCKLHACALDIIQNHTAAVLYNICLAERVEEKDIDECGASLSIDSKQIKTCADNNQGNKLLKYYREKSLEINYSYVPYIMINGLEIQIMDINIICRSFINPPPPCFLGLNSNQNN